MRLRAGDPFLRDPFLHGTKQTVPCTCQNMGFYVLNLDSYHLSSSHLKIVNVKANSVEKES